MSLVHLLVHLEVVLAVCKTNHLHIRDGVFYFRAIVPKDLAVKTGARELKFSLKTRSPEDARRRCRALSSEFEVLFRELKSMPDITREKIYQIARKHFQSIVRLNDDVVAWPDWVVEFNEELQSDLSRMVGTLKTGVYSAGIIDLAKWHFEKKGVKDFDEHGEEEKLLCNALVRAKVEYTRTHCSP